MTMKHCLIALLVVGQLSACANQSTLDHLESAKVGCAAGISWQCDNIPIWEQKASQERSDTAGNVALTVVAIPLIAGLLVLEAAAMQPPPAPMITTSCTSFGRSTTCFTN
jgi:hypothetical protein